MKISETLKLLNDKDFLDKIYHFSYHRCNSSFEAEDLCSDIVLAVISAIHKQEFIEFVGLCFSVRLLKGLEVA